MKHGMSGTRFYHVWCAMKQRCFYPSHNRFKSYGGRGITVDGEWLTDFRNFHRDMFASYQEHCKDFGEKNTTLDRIDSQGHYTKENCRWNTLWNQNLNRTNNRLLAYKDELGPLTMWARRKGFKRGVLESRLRRGWSEERAIETPVIKKFSPSNRHKAYCLDGVGKIRFKTCICK